MALDVDIIPVGVRIATFISDGPDEGREPDLRWATSGQVRLIPVVDQVMVKDTDGNSAIMGKSTFIGDFGEDGWARWQGEPSTEPHLIYVVDLTSDKTRPQIIKGATHAVEFTNISVSGQPISVRGGYVRLSHDLVQGADFVNIADLLPAGPPSTITVIEGPPGPPGPVGPQGEPGDAAGEGSISDEAMAGLMINPVSMVNQSTVVLIDTETSVRDSSGENRLLAIYNDMKS